MSIRCVALVPCAGVGARAGVGGPKQYAPLAGRTLVAHTLQALARVQRIAATLVVLAPEDDAFERLVPDYAGHVLRGGGATRADTVARGVDELLRAGLAGEDDWVLVHDAARCLVQPAWIDRLIDACLGDAVGGLLALPLADTIKREDGGRAASTLDRRALWAAQTPQMFRAGLLRQALAHGAEHGIDITDEASAVEALGHAPRLVRGDWGNLKVTWPEDFALAERLLTR